MRKINKSDMCVINEIVLDYMENSVVKFDPALEKAKHLVNLVALGAVAEIKEIVAKEKESEQGE